LTNSVTPMPRHWLFAWARAAKSIFTSHEDDHDPDQHRPGRLTWATSMRPIASVTCSK
jgi:hypothetical protein